jgi:hypothetical protein
VHGQSGPIRTPGDRRPVLDRRRFLGLTAGLPIGLAGWLGQGCAAGGGGASDPIATGGGPSPPSGTPGPTAIPVPKVNGPINVHPLRRLDVDPNETDPVIIPELVSLQLRAVYELGFDGLRITAPFGDRANFLAAIPYVRAARALGIDGIVILADFAGLALARALYDERRRPAVLSLYETVFAAAPDPVRPGMGGFGPHGVGRIAFQILNEPTHFLGVPPDVYVHDFLSPCFNQIKRDDPEIIVASAAEVGNLAGPARIRAMLEAGLERVADRICYHIYSRDVIPLLPENVQGTVWITEAGTAGTALHLGWVRDVFPEIRARIEDTTRIFYYDLFDPDPGVYRLLDIEAEGSGYQAIVESTDLYAFYVQNVAAKAGGQPLLTYDALVPDIRAYFPTAADVQAYDAAFAP